MKKGGWFGKLAVCMYAEIVEKRDTAMQVFLKVSQIILLVLEEPFVQRASAASGYIV